MNSSPTIPQLEAELERARQEIGALRDLLAAVAEARPPLPAVTGDGNPDGWQAYLRAGSRRMEFAGAWADVSNVRYSSAVSAEVIRERAAKIREECARPLGYAAEDAR